MKKNKLNKVKEERKVDINDPIVFIEEDSALTRKRIISYPFNKEKKSFTLEELAKKSNKTGPGAYNIDHKEKPHGPELVNDKLSRLPNYDNKNPGVGEYEVDLPSKKVEKTDPIYGIPKAERKNPFEVNKEKLKVPGSGAYDISLKEQKKFYVDNANPRFPDSANKIPGVGEYDINDAEIKLKTKTGISNAKSARKDPFEVNKEKLNIPGAGSYNINKEQNKKFYVEKNMERFARSGNDNPGVGEYDINEAELKLKTKVATIATNKSERKDPFEVNKEKKIVPGAGTYNTISTNKRGVYIEKNAPRFSDNDNKIPGVGEYDINDAELKLKNKTGISNVKSERKDPFELNKYKKIIPGVGSYDTEDKLNKNRFYIDKNVPRFGDSANKIPGVGEYDINDAEIKLKNKTGISNVKSARKDPFEVNKEKQIVPGAGTYNISKSIQGKFYMDKNVPRFGDSANKIPGVGEYDINDAELKLKNKTGISTAKSARKDPFEVNKEKQIVPGAGTYNTIDNDRHKFYIDKNLERFKTSKNKIPGVGEYDINDAEIKLKNKRGISTSKSARRDPFEVNKEQSRIPGAGTYNIIQKSKNKFYIEKNINRFSNIEKKIPGVGEYDINDAEIKLKNKTGISTSKSERKDPFEVNKEKLIVPGSGAYEINKNKKGNFYIEKTVPRFKDADNKKPGVGEYDINDAEIKLKKRVGISSSKSERKDPFEVKKESKIIPGAGAYNINKSGPKKFYIEQNMERFSTSYNGKPGVGEYDINEADLKLRRTSPKVTTLKENRKDPFYVPKDKINLGPGSYNVSSQNEQGYHFAKEPKLTLKENKNPGVGEYEYPPVQIKLKTRSPAYGNPRAKRLSPFVNERENVNVGPGSYSIRYERSKAGFQKFSTLPRKL